MKNAIVITIICLLLVVITGCQTGLTYATQSRKITVKTDPYNARVYQINPVDKHETFLGMSPVRDQPVSVITGFGGKYDKAVEDFMTTQIGMVNIRVEKDGYYDYVGNLATDKNEILQHRVELEQETK